MDVDWVARALAVAGLLIGLGSLMLTAYLWLRSGAVIKVNAFVRAESASVRVEVSIGPDSA